MCDTVSQPNGVDIQTLAELRKFLRGGEVVKYNYYDTLNENSCLCQVNLEETLRKNHIKATYEGWGWEIE